MQLVRVNFILEFVHKQFNYGGDMHLAYMCSIAQHLDFVFLLHLEMQL